MLPCGYAKKDICIAIGKDKSVLFLELKRNILKRGYSASLVHEYAHEREECFRIKRKFTETVKRHIVKYLTEEQWSSEQIVGDAKRRGIEKVSCERIYQFIREDKRSVGVIWRHCRRQQKHRKSPVVGKKLSFRIKFQLIKDYQSSTKNNVLEIGKLIQYVGAANKSAILTTTERLTGFW